jgi:hypothetical protein
LGLDEGYHRGVDSQTKACGGNLDYGIRGNSISGFYGDILDLIIIAL